MTPKVSIETLKEHYKEHAARKFYQELIDSMSSGTSELPWMLGWFRIRKSGVKRTVNLYCQIVWQERSEITWSMTKSMLSISKIDTTPNCRFYNDLEFLEGVIWSVSQTSFYMYGSLCDVVVEPQARLSLFTCAAAMLWRVCARCSVAPTPRPPNRAHSGAHMESTRLTISWWYMYIYIYLCV